MRTYPPTLLRLIKEFAHLPGIGEKTATRLALHVLNISRAQTASLAQSILDVKEKIRLCSICFGLTDSDPCRICTDPERATGVLCVVEETDDLMALDKSGAFRGRYHVLHGVLSPLDGVGPDQLKIKELLDRVEKEKIKEVILANNTDVEGEATASYLARLLSSETVRVSRIASGIPIGCDIKYTDQVTLKRALEGRRDMEGC
ncbi:MAG: recombination mediator RecR [Deltaproteobacteria bacterium]|jgi:recombination protein RecR|nr:recombination mediator RecR [Deltaproteobacteria bacterium]